MTLVHGGCEMIERKNYFSKDYTLTPNREEEKMEPETRYGIVVGNKRVRVRTSPTLETTENVIDTVCEGDRFEILEELPNFYRIDYYGNKNCFISFDFFVED